MNVSRRVTADELRERVVQGADTEIPTDETEHEPEDDRDVVLPARASDVGIARCDRVTYEVAKQIAGDAQHDRRSEMLAQPSRPTGSSLVGRYRWDRLANVDLRFDVDRHLQAAPRIIVNRTLIPCSPRS